MSRTTNRREWLAFGTILTTAFLVAVMLANHAHARSASQIQAELNQMQAQLQAYQQKKVANRCGSGGNAQVCRLLDAAIADAQRKIEALKQELARANGGGNPGGGADPCDKVRRDVAAKAQQSKAWAYNYVRANPRPRNGYYIRINRPPVYCSNPSWTVDPREYKYSTHEIYRAIDQHTNNGHQITGMGKW